MDIFLYATRMENHGLKNVKEGLPTALAGPPRNATGGTHNTDFNTEVVSPTGSDSSFCQDEVLLVTVHIYQAHRRLMLKTECQIIQLQ